jgi:hypothetical protein
VQMEDATAEQVKRAEAEVKGDSVLAAPLQIVCCRLDVAVSQGSGAAWRATHGCQTGIASI